MRTRLLTTAALCVGLAVSQSAHAATPTLDGKKVKTLTITASGGLQDNDKDNASLTSPDRLACEAPRCAKLKFTYKPAKGVKGDLMFTVTWTNPASDIDLYVGELDKHGDASDIGHCGGAATTSEKVFIPASNLKSGKSYVLVVDFYRSLNETAKGTVQIGVPSTVPDHVPDQYDGQAPGTVYPIDCTL